MKRIGILALIASYLGLTGCIIAPRDRPPHEENREEHHEEHHEEHQDQPRPDYYRGY